MLSREALQLVESILNRMIDDFWDDETKIYTNNSESDKTTFGFAKLPKFQMKSHIPITDIYDNEEKSVIVALIPGIPHENVKVELSDDLKAIEISFTTYLPKTPNNLELKHREFEDHYRVGDSHEHSVAIINDGVYDLDKITSTLTHGILYITLPKIVPKKKVKPTITVNKL